ncbi:MlrC C-terminal domain-containing protein, partial [Streptomyces canus]|uniref:MlrC C-terminal domain-containing protein n=1 Tax=Streptomyces canus TaxID=58343 RepID=UPI0037D9A68C
MVVYDSLPGPSAVDTAARAGVGATVTVTAGAAVDDRHAGLLNRPGGRLWL